MQIQIISSALGTYTRQFLNCWLGYVVSQPVDFDLTVMMYFAKAYVGLPFLALYIRELRNKTTIGRSPNEADGVVSSDNLSFH